MSAPSRISPVISAFLLSLALSVPLVAPARAVAREEARETPAETTASQETLHEEVAQLAERVRTSLEREDATGAASADETPADPRALTTALYEQLVAAATDPGTTAVVTDDDEAALALLATGAESPNGVARAFQLVADELGLTCETVTNPSKTWVWNRVLVDDAWLHVDVAAALEQQRQENADDAAAEPADSITQDWLLVDEDELASRDETHRQWEPVDEPEPTGEAAADEPEPTVETESGEPAPTDVVKTDEPEAEAVEPDASEQTTPEGPETPASSAPDQLEPEPEAPETPAPAPADDQFLSPEDATATAPNGAEQLLGEIAADATAAADEAASEESLPQKAASADAIAEVERYAYAVRPLLAPFNEYLYVQTDNPDPTSFRIADKNTAYSDSDGIFSVETVNFLDVSYEDASTHRVNGGYLFVADGLASDGGQLVIQAVEGRDVSDTSISVSCPRLMRYIDYLVENVATKGDFFDNLDAVQSFLDEYAVYPRGVFDTNSPNPKTPYPFYAVSPYYELDLNAHYEMYDFMDKGGLLETAAYPYVLDSLGFPGAIASVAERLDPNCTVENGSVHWAISITHGGETHSYGGAGTGGHSSLLGSHVSQTFFFDGSAGDWGSSVTLEQMRDSYLGHSSQGVSDLESYSAQLTLSSAVGSGSWISVMTEGGFAYSTSYTYVTAYPTGGTRTVSDAWVDGRYVSVHEQWYTGATFADHPDADIVRRNVPYTASDGTSGTTDLIYSHDEGTDCWSLGSEYTWRRTYGSDVPLTLTRQQVKAMAPDAQTSTPLDHWLVYNGTQPPGTPHERVAVTSIRLDDHAELCAKGHMDISMSVEPADADFQDVTWTSSDETVAKADSTWIVDGSTNETYRSTSITSGDEGTAVLTCTSQDGNHTATCRVTVTQPSTGLQVEGTKLMVGQSKRLTATVEPSTAAQHVSWGCYYPSVATVDPDGTVHAVGPGYAYVNCSTTDGRSKSVYVYVIDRITSLSLREHHATLCAGGTTSLSVDVTPNKPDGVVWSSSNERVATVDEYGTVTGVTKGTATITTTTLDGSLSDTCTVDVTSPTTSASIAPTNLTVGQSKQLSVTVSPADACQTVTGWYSYNRDAVTVDDKGVVTGVGPGSSWVECYTTDGRCADVLITVIPALTSLSLPSTASMCVNGALQLAPVTKPQIDDGLMWSSSNPAVAEVDEYGSVLGNKRGSAVITCSTPDGSHTATCTVTVTVPSEYVDVEWATLRVGEKKKLKATVYPSEASQTIIGWWSYDPSIATVDENGVVTGLKAGEVYIGCSSTDYEYGGTYITVTGSNESRSKKAQTLRVKAPKKRVSAKKVKKKAQKVKALTVTGAKGKLTYKKVSGSKRLTVNKKTGKVTVKKGTKKGTYTIKVKVSAAATSTYKAASKTVKVKVVVK